MNSFAKISSINGFCFAYTLVIDRKTATAVDLAEGMAAEAALQQATLELSLSLIPEMTKKWAK